jgi:hypothetical protein
MALPDPVASAKSYYEASTLVNVHLLAALKGNEVFHSADHKAASREVRSELKSRKKAKDDSELKSILSNLSCDLRRTILRGKATGQWISVMPSTVNGTVFSTQEYRDAFLLRYGRCPGDLQPHCGGCGQKFCVRHALECKKDGNVISRHNEIRDELADLAAKAIIPSAVRNEPFIPASFPAVKMPELDPHDQPAVSRNLQKSRGEIRGDVSIRGLWNRGTDCIIDVRVTDTDAKSNLSKDPAKVLEAHEKENKKKYLKAFLEQRSYFTSFVVSTDGLIGKEAKTLLKKLSTLLAEKWGKSY